MSKFLLAPLSRRRFLTTTALAGVGAGLIISPFGNMAFAEDMVHLRLIETTDVHVNIFPYDYYRDREDNTVGLARTAALLNGARAEAPNSLLLDNGDFLQGNPMGDFMAYERGLDGTNVHPVMKAMNLLGYDAATLGNHEFNYGLDFLNKALAGANFPFVLANLANGSLAGSPTADKTFLKPYMIIERTLKDGTGKEHKVKIGLIGFVPPQIMNWDNKWLAGNVMTRDIVETAKAYVPQMREAGAEIVIALCHSGINGGQPTEGAEDSALYLATVPGIDAILTGHQHKVLPGPDYAAVDGVDAEKGTLHGVPAVMAGFWGSHLGIIDLMLQKDGAKWKVVDHKSEARPIYKRDGKNIVPLIDPRMDVEDAAREGHEGTLAYVRRPVGETSAPINSFFSLVYDDPSVQIVSQAQTWYISELIKGTANAALPVLSAAAPFKAGGRGGPDYYTDVPKGPVAIKNVADLYLYPNTVRAVLVDGATVKEWLERSAGMFNQLTPGKAEQELVNNDFPSYNFDVIDGVTYKIDLSQPNRYDKDGKLAAPDAHRIVDLQFQGKPIDPAQKFIVATNNYRAGGGGNFPGVGPDKIVIEAPDANRDVLIRYIHDKGTINPSADNNWSFAPVAGVTKALFDSSPNAQAYAASLKNVTYVGPGENGFARYALTLSA
ncbi:bifunctional 2',3'-cyclic-nucleotide 2'-phosphodiesterase/3'-nucleotidase [Radicibacter daui]|uniref:bifunctional 2',3'-cyclic-nucleotide 2'-phosphodiesterase/3'-nucleotidase n=1 Tax=Radicibacter daui TaxID=3064829 RepID=UPI0040468B82